MRVKEEGSRFRVGGDALQQRQRITAAIGNGGRQARRRKQRVDGDDLLQQARDGAKRVPENGSQVRQLFTLLAQLQKGQLSLVLVTEIIDELIQARREGSRRGG